MSSEIYFEHRVHGNYEVGSGEAIRYVDLKSRRWNGYERAEVDTIAHYTYVEDLVIEAEKVLAAIHFLEPQLSDKSITDLVNARNERIAEEQRLLKKLEEEVSRKRVAALKKLSPEEREILGVKGSLND